MSLVECVPNFSLATEGAELAALRDALTSVPRVRVLDASVDADHGRAVVTFAGPSAAVGEAAFRVVAAATRCLDLRRHHGVHPRIGATDVLPFIPLEGATREEVVGLAHQVGERIAAELELPVYFYGDAALVAERRALPAVRRGGLEKLAAAIASDPARAPDRGPRRLHPTAGAIAVGVRPFLIAYNVNLESRDLPAAQAIAAEIREAGGGLPGVRALGLALERAGHVQVSTNVCDHERSGILDVFRAVEERALARGIVVLESELVGLAPRAALNAEIAAAVKLRDFDPRRCLLEDLLERP